MNFAAGVPVSLLKSIADVDPAGQALAASGGCGALVGVVRSSVASTAFATLAQSAEVKPSMSAETKDAQLCSSTSARFA